jgi:4-carboxymuconolactone decarboxylase
MYPRPLTPRIPPLKPEEQDDEARELMSGSAADGPVNVTRTIVRHPGLFRRWAPFVGKLGNGKLPGRDREMLIMRTAWRCQSEYEWAQHRRGSARAGMTNEEIERIKDGPAAPGWSTFESLLLRAADELHDDSSISDATWVELAARYDERQLIEVPMLVGHYHLAAYTMNALGIQLEHGVPGFDG